MMTSPLTYAPSRAIIQAMKFDGNNGRYIELWSKGEFIPSPVLEPSKKNPTGAYLQWRGRKKIIIVGWWIIKFVDGKYAACDDAFFIGEYAHINNTEPIGDFVEGLHSLIKTLDSVTEAAKLIATALKKRTTI